MGHIFRKYRQGKCAPGALIHLVLLAFLLLGLSSPTHAQITEGNSRLSLPASQLDEPFETPVYFTGNIAFGGGFQKQAADIGYGGSLIFRPGHSVNIFSTFLGWRESMVVQVDFLEVPDGGNILSGDLIMRRYFTERGDRKPGTNLFLGLGSGVSDIRRPEPGDDAAGEHWSVLVEGGAEWYSNRSRMLFIKGQYRWMINAGRTWSAWSVMAGFGLVWP